MRSQMHVPQLSRVNKILIAGSVGIFILGQILKMSTGIKLVSILGLSVSGLKAGLIYQLLTYPFVEANFTAMLFNALLVWFIGSELEQKWGEKFYLKFLAISTIVSGITFLIIGLSSGMGFLPFFGLTGINLALILAYGIIYSERTMVFMFIFPMKAKYFCMLLGGIELYMGLFSNYSMAAWAHLAAMAGGYGYLKYKSLKARGWSVDQVKQQRHRNKMKQRLKIVPEKAPDKADPEKPKYFQ